MGSQSENYGDGDLLDMFAQCVARDHKRPAVNFQGSCLSYGELDERSSGLAALLISRGVGVGDPVIVLAVKNLDLVVFFLAVLKAGACYVPLDLETLSDTRIQYTINIIQPRVIISSDQRQYTGFDVLSWAEVGNAVQLIYPVSLHNLPVRTRPADLAYIIFTSGTTSDPKGVMIPRYALSNYVQHGGEETPFNMNVNDSDTVLLVFSPAFDGTKSSIGISDLADAALACTGVIFSTLCNGGGLEIAGPGDLEASLEKCTIFPTTPSILQSIRAPKRFRKLRAIFLGGEAPSPGLVNTWHSSSRRIFNCYGPSETTCASLIAEVSPGKPILLGHPMMGSSVCLFNANLDPSEEGEICITGPGLAVGYFKDHVLTRLRFFNYHGQRFFHTGDYARQEKDGLKFLGREDALVKNRGFMVNIESQVVAVLQAQDGVESATAIQQDGKIIAFVTPKGVDSRLIRTNLAIHHDAFVVPDHIYALDQLPVTSNGKVDTRKLQEGVRTLDFQDHEKSQSMSRESSILRLAVARNIGIPVGNISSEDTFWELGGSSLSAIAVLSDLRLQNLSISIAQLLGQNSLDQLVASLKPFSNVFSDDVSCDASESYPLTTTQEKLISGSITTHCLNYMVLTTKIQHKEHHGIEENLKEAWRQILQRHSVFRTKFSLSHNTQCVLPCDGELDWQTVVRPSEDWKDELNKQTQELIRLTQATDPENPPTKFRLVTVPYDHSVLIWLVHHARVDGWSARIIIQELQELLDGHSLPPAPQFVHASVVQSALAGSYATQARDFWGSVAKAVQEAPHLPFAEVATPRNWENRTHSRQIDDGCNAKELEVACRKVGISTATAIYSAWALTLMKYTESEVAAFGAVFSGRNLPMQRADRVVGPMMNVLPFMTQIANTDDKSVWLHRVQDQLTHMSDLQWISAPQLSQQDTLGRFETLVVLQYGLPEASQICNAIPGPWRFDQTQMTQSLWTLLVESSGEYLNFRLVYDDLVVTGAKTERALEHFKNVLDEVLKPEIQTIHELKQRVISGSEEAALTNHSLELHEPYQGPLSLKTAFEAIVDEQPHAIAVESLSGVMTYQELDEAANYLALTLLKDASVGKTVAILSDGSLHWLIAILSVVKTGATYCPIDINLPSKLANLMIEWSKACVLIIPDHRREFQIEPTSRCKKIVLGSTATPPMGANKRLPDCVSLQDPVYLMFTSGTTGTPKGFCANNLGILSYISFLPARLHAASGRRIAQTFSVGFDASAAEIFGTLCYGATLLLKDLNDPLANLRTANATMLTPSFLSSLDPRDFPNLDTITVGGEALPQGLVDSWCPGRQIYNGYGPSECTIGCIFTRITPEKPVTLGRPIPRMSAYLLDENGDVVPIGFPGEIYLTGIQVLKGYTMNGDADAFRFQPDPFNRGYTMFRTGDIGRWTENMEVEFLGRRDRQVKVRGFRVNLDEVEAVIQRSSSTIRRNAVIYSNNSLTAFIAPKTVDANCITEALNSTLPPFARPSRIVQLDQLPQTTNQKTDYQALARLDFPTVSEHLTPLSTPVQHAVAHVWRETLGAVKDSGGEIFQESNFLDIGGHSLLQLKLARELSRQFGCQVSLQTVLRNTTLGELAEAVCLESQQGLHKDATYSSFLSSGYVDTEHESIVSEVEKQMVLISNQSEVPSAFHISLLLTIEGPINNEHLLSAIHSATFASRLLRTRYNVVGDSVSRTLADPTPLPQIRTMPGVDIGLIQHEVNRPFDLSNDPLLRMTIIQTSFVSRCLLIVAHHSIVDANSVQLLLSRIKEFYLKQQYLSSEMMCARSTESHVSQMDYLDWIRWKTSVPNFTRKLFWGTYLLNSLTFLPQRSSTPTFAGNGTTKRLTISPNLANALEQCCNKTRSSMQQLIVSCAALAANRVYGVKDLLMAVPFSDRSEPGTEAILGVFLDVLPLRIRMDAENTRSSESFLAAAKKASEMAVANQMPSHAIQEAVGRETLLFDIMVSFHSRAEAFEFDLPGCTTKLQRLKPLGAKFPLMFEVFQEEEGFILEVEHNIALVNDRRAEELLRAFYGALNLLSRGELPADIVLD